MKKITVIILVLLSLKVFAQNKEDMVFSETFLENFSLKNKKRKPTEKYIF